MPEEKNIHEAIIAVMKEVGYVQKKRSAGLSYSYAGEAALIEAVRPSMVEHGIYMHVQEITKVNRENYVTAKGTAMANTLVQTVIRFEHAPSATFIDVPALGEGADSGDKSANKASTGAYKYAIRQTFCIETGDDPDDTASEARAVKSIKARQDAVEVTSQDPLDHYPPEESTVLTGDVNKDFPIFKFTPKQIRNSADLVSNISKASGKAVPEVLALVKTLDTTKEYSIKEVSELLKGKE
jgi:hypothetical protein